MQNILKNKVVQKIDKMIEYVLILCIIVICVYSMYYHICITYKYSTMDQIWVYSWGNMFKQGLTPYRDYNTIVSPFMIVLSFFFVSLFPKFSTFYISILITKAVSVIISFFYTKKYIKTKYILLIFLTLTFCYFNFEYNTIVYILMMLSFYLIERISRENDNLFHYFLLALLSFLMIGTKVSIGILLCISVLTIVILVQCKKMYLDQISPIKAANCISVYVSSVGIMLFLSISYLVNHQIWNDFIDQNFKGGTGHFFDRITIWVLFYLLFSFLPLISVLINFKKYKSLHVELLFLCFVCICFTFNAAGTPNAYHIGFVILISVLIMFYTMSIEYNYKQLIFILFAMSLALIFSKAKFLTPSQAAEKATVETQDDKIMILGDRKCEIAADGTFVNEINKYINSHPDDTIFAITGNSLLIPMTNENYHYHKYLDNMISGNFGTKKIEDIVSRYGPAYYIVPVKEVDESYYDALLDKSVFDFFEGKKIKETITYDGEVYYNVYDLNNN